MLRAAVPEATVDKDGDALSRERRCRRVAAGRTRAGAGAGTADRVDAARTGSPTPAWCPAAPAGSSWRSRAGEDAGGRKLVDCDDVRLASRWHHVERVFDALGRQGCRMGEDGPRDRTSLAVQRREHATAAATSATRTSGRSTRRSRSSPARSARTCSTCATGTPSTSTSGSTGCAGTHLLDFQDAIRWDELYRTCEASADESQKFGRELKQGLDTLTSSSELVVLSIQELNAKGLLGAERGTNSNFAALCRNNLDSNKSSTAGGAFGLGKAVLWRCSALSTVLFHSDLVEPLDGDPRSRSTAGFSVAASSHGTRLTARSSPARDGSASSTRTARRSAPGTAAAEAADAAARSSDRLDRHVDSRPRIPGPVAGGTRGRRGHGRGSGARRSAVHFWPAIHDGLLEPTVGYWADGTWHGAHRRPCGPRTSRRPVRGHGRRSTGRRICDRRSAEPGGVVHRTVSLEIPATARRRTRERSRTRRTSRPPRRPRRTSRQLVNTVALVRGLGMVVEYWKLPNLRIGARPFHAVLRCGEAAHEQARVKRPSSSSAAPSRPRTTPGRSHPTSRRPISAAEAPSR